MFRMDAYPNPMGEIVSIWIKRMKGGPMDSAAQAELIAGRGIRGNANQGGRRQVTIIDEAAWKAATDELGVNVPPEARRANVLVRGIDLENSRGQLLKLGGAVVRIFGETRPCEQMDDAAAGLRVALQPHWRAGAFGEIVEAGTIRVGDTAGWIESTG